MQKTPGGQQMLMEPSHPKPAGHCRSSLHWSGSQTRTPASLHLPARVPA